MLQIEGQKIARLRLMTCTEMREQGWEDWRSPPVVIELENGLKLFPSRDEEGNGPGALFGSDAEGEFMVQVTEVKG